MESRKCSKCKKELPATDEFFSKQKLGKYDLSSWCRACKYKHNKKVRERNKKINKNIIFNALNKKACTKCGRELSATTKYFGLSRQQKDSLTYWCRECVREYNKSDKRKAKNREYNNTKKGKELRRGYNYKAAFGVSIKQLNDLFELQNYKCAICGTIDPGGRWDCLNLDHNHKTRQIRGLLCLRCNRLLGCAEDNVDLLKKAILYLNKHKKV